MWDIRGRRYLVREERKGAKLLINKYFPLSVAPMMDWTDRGDKILFHKGFSYLGWVMLAEML
jgi:hypothetical protein